ncbi:MAG: hypothetical protein L0Z55_02695 [Planctomycetes bacterium]|nr:hypothetical protein [Planctomycetota bacterium]
MNAKDGKDRGKDRSMAARVRARMLGARAGGAEMDEIGCEFFALHFPRWVEGKTGGFSTSLIEEHLEGCATCGAAAAREAEELRVLVENLSASEPPAGFAARLRSRIDADVRRAASRRGRARTLRRAAAVLLFACLATAIGGAYFLPWSGSLRDLPEPAHLAARDARLAPRSAGAPAPLELFGDAAAAETALVRGDLDGNGIFNHSDIRLLGGHVQGTESAVPCLRAADVDGDQTVGPADFVCCVQLLCQPEFTAGMTGLALAESTLPCDDLVCMAAY